MLGALPHTLVLACPGGRECAWVQIYDLETRYIATANPQGNALKGARHCYPIACFNLGLLRVCLQAEGVSWCAELTCVHFAGYEGFLSQSSAPARRGPVKPEERLFSSSSVTGASHLPA